ncbi:TPA: hypothetical protein PL519_003455 [Clostridium botulinum]|nr:hypothetical protein [Clostridium botulinum]
MGLVEQYEYVIFEDELGKTFILNSRSIKDCVFAGSAGRLKEVERGIIKKPECEKENSSFYLGALFDKKKEYLSKRFE